jgi:mandelamide amidase
MQAWQLDLTSVAALLRRGDLTAEAYASALLERIRRVGTFNAFAALDESRFLASAFEADRRSKAGRPRGLLHGVPLVYKDNIDVVGYPTGCSSPPLSANYPARNAALVDTMDRSGAIAMGKTSMHELALGAPRLVGDPVNPNRADLMTGGSSSGTAVAVSAGLAPGGFGTDTGGSVRIPAAHCGIAGLRPTLGRYPLHGIVALCPSRDTAGPMARSMADVALLDAAATGEPDLPEVRLQGLRIGVARRYFLDDLAPQTAVFAEQELGRLRRHGAQVVEVAVDEVEELNQAISFVVLLHEAPLRLRDYVAQRLPGVAMEAFVEQVASPGCRRLLTGLYGLGPGSFQPPPAEAYEAALTEHRPRLIRAYQRVFTEHRIEALVYPTTPLPAACLPVEETVFFNGRERNRLLTYLRLIDPSSNAGLPGITIPAGRTDDGVPLGLAFDGPSGSDRRLLALGIAYQAVLPALDAPRRLG